MEKLIDIIMNPSLDKWNEKNIEAFEELFGKDSRYPEKAKAVVTLRAPEFRGDGGVPFAAYIHPSNASSGPYGGMSFVMFPSNTGPCLVGLGVGTQGLSPDEQILSRPGHARKVGAICNWVNKKYGGGKIIAWAKKDPVRTDLDVPDVVRKSFQDHVSVFDRYGNVMYAIFSPGETKNRDATKEVTKAFLDLMFEERGYGCLKKYESEASKIKSDYTSKILPDLKEDDVVNQLHRRKFVIIEGPPGTGKTRMATKILEKPYKKHGRSIQFHPNTTYETFIGGLAPAEVSTALGFGFTPQQGELMIAAHEAAKDPSKPYLLHIDEINRADLAKILGEAIFLFEPRDKRSIHVPYNFGGNFNRIFAIPDNLHVLGTMNSADRSIAIVDIAVRRRFAFLKLWPQLEVVRDNSCSLMQEAFEKMLLIFVEYASDDAFSLVPGHSYFLEKDEKLAPMQLKVNLVPLLEEYLAQGYIANFAESIRAYIQWVESVNIYSKNI